MILFFISYFLYTYLKIISGMHMLQQNFYNEGNRYLKWINNNVYKSLITIDLITLLLPFIVLINTKTAYIISFIIYMLIFIIKLIEKKKTQVKIKLVYTFRIKRLILTTIIIYIIFLLCYFRFINDNYILLIVLSLLTVFAHIHVYIAYIINLPIEKLIYLKYKKKAINKLQGMNTINIGITGSYGKTSSKNILNDILSVKYLSYPTPGNLNTPLGIMKTINNNLDKFEEIFIAEISISAPKTHDIEKSCEIIKPKYGIITNIGLAHLDTFKTEEAIREAKFKLIEALPSDGLGILNKDDSKQVNYQIKNNCRIKWIGIDNQTADIVAKNIKYNKNGTEFDAIFKEDNQKLHLKTCLFGKPNIYNILAAILLAKELKLTNEEIIKGVNNIKPIEHRLEIKKKAGYTIIDDAYNSNPIGSALALDVLNIMPGKKVIITPGMIELSDKMYELNYEFGCHIAKVADYVILVGKKQTKPIQDALFKNNYPEKSIFITNDIKKAFPKIEEIKDNDTYVLLENDLPDLFNEKN